MNPSSAVLCALFIASCAENPAPPVSAWNVDRLQRGDTTVVRNSGADSPLADLTLVEELVIGKVVGSDQEMFGQIGSATATPHGGVLVSEYSPFRIQRFDSTARLRAVYGARGEGPGEFMIPARVILDGKGNVFHWDVVNNLFAVYDSSGRHLRSFRPKVGAGITPRARNGLAIDSAGVVSMRADLFGENGTTREPGIFRLSSDGTILARMPEPASYGAPSRTVRYSPEGGAQDMPVPLAPEFNKWFVTPGIWASGHSASYSILLHQFPSGLLRIESDAAAIPVSRVERADNAAAATMELQFGDRSAKFPPSQIPEQKPFFKMVQADQSNRLWVQLFRQGKRIVETKCPVSQTEFVGGVGGEGGASATGACADGKNPRPIARWEEAIVYDIFQPSGEFSGRIALPANAEFRAALTNKVWLRVLDSLGVQSIVRYRVIADPKSPVAPYWK